MSEDSCYHCGQPIPDDVDLPVTVAGLPRAMCCYGCQAVAQSIVDNGLADYYRSRDALPESPREAMPAILEQLALYDHVDFQKSFVKALGESEREASLLLEGITCAACIWLNEQHVGKLKGVTAVNINYATRRARVRWDEAQIKLSDILGAIAAIGYRAYPYDAAKNEEISRKERREAMWRLWVAGFGMMQVMMYAYPVYIANGDMTADIESLMRWASLLLTLPVIFYSSAPFFRPCCGPTGSRRPWRPGIGATIPRSGGKAEHDLDEAVLKPYLGLEAMLGAMFDCSARLFGLEFREIEGPFYHPDVRGWEVTRAGNHVAVFLGDYFARGSKRSGAWCSAMRGQRKLGGQVRPIVVNVCNFANGNPCLLSYDDARTLFHEFGHALHQMLSDVTYGFISGTSVARDFVELPSQLYEHWLEVPSVLEAHARHHETGEPMPADMLERLLAAGTYDQGFATVEFVSSAMVDLEFHTGTPPTDPMQKQAEVLESLGMPRAIRMRHATPHFAHVFSGDGYSSGYYSYMWSEVMDADAFAAFEEAGDPFDPETAAKLERFILSAGGSEDAEALYLKFRGKMPGVEALLKGRGLLDAA